MAGMEQCERPETEFDPTATDYNAEGVDLTLVRWSLRLTPAQRLDFHVSWLNGLIEMLNAGTAGRSEAAGGAERARG